MLNVQIDPWNPRQIVFYDLGVGICSGLGEKENVKRGLRKTLTLNP
jgi:hypothetical protein